MTDRELLVLAAKAVGYDIHIWGTIGEENISRMDLPNHPRWNPIRDDGDAYRLETALQFDVVWFDKFVSVGMEEEAFSDHGGDAKKARRYAGVRAAARVGKDMP